MKGADEYYDLFPSGQYGRLFMLRGQHARGKTFAIWILPKGEVIPPRLYSNVPVNKDAVKVYGIVSGNPGWTESYGWLLGGPWQRDFNKMVDAKRAAIEEKCEREAQKKLLSEQTDREKKIALLSDYKEGDSL